MADRFAEMIPYLRRHGIDLFVIDDEHRVRRDRSWTHMYSEVLYLTEDERRTLITFAREA